MNKNSESLRFYEDPFGHIKKMEKRIKALEDLILNRVSQFEFKLIPIKKVKNGHE